MSKYNLVSRFVALSLATITTSAYAITEEDSVHSWGPWETLVQPAAGPQAPVPITLSGPVVPGFGAGDASQFTALITTPTSTSTTSATESICAAGSACSYALIYSQTGINQTSRQTATATLSPIPVGIRVAVDGLLDIQGPLALGDGAQDTTTLNVTSTTALALTLGIENAPVTYNLGGNWSTFSIADGFAFMNGKTVNPINTPFAYGDATIARVVDGRGTFTKANFIFGESTGVSDLNDLNAGNVTANYNGNGLLSRGTQVNIAVNFGEGTWNGSWNGGSDAAGISPTLSTDGVKVLTGVVGFNASGTIDGANIVSNVISANDASAISGTVNGSFFGNNAGSLAGAVNINKTRTDGTYTDSNYQDLFVTTINAGEQ